MTLSTNLRIVEPTNVREVFEFARGLLNASHGAWEDKDWYDGDRAIMNKGGQGFAAWLIVRYGGDGPLHADPCECGDTCFCPPPASVELDFDTSYGYTAENGAGCSDLHAWLITEIGPWLTDRGIDWYWQNEFTGEWHHGINSALAAFGDAQKGKLRTAMRTV